MLDGTCPARVVGTIDSRLTDGTVVVSAASHWIAVGGIDMLWLSLQVEGGVPASAG